MTIFEIEPTAATRTASPYQRKIIFSKNIKDFQKECKKMSALAILRLFMFGFVIYCDIFERWIYTSCDENRPYCVLHGGNTRRKSVRRRRRVRRIFVVARIVFKLLPVIFNHRFCKVLLSSSYVHSILLINKQTLIFCVNCFWCIT